MISTGAPNLAFEVRPGGWVAPTSCDDSEGQRNHLVHLVQIGNIEHERELASSVNESEAWAHASSVDCRLDEAIKTRVGNVQGQVRRVGLSERISRNVVASSPKDSWGILLAQLPPTCSGIG